VLFGFGVGLVVASLALFFAYMHDRDDATAELYTEAPLSETEVMEHALLMGMVWPDNDDVTVIRRALTLGMVFGRPDGEQEIYKMPVIDEFPLTDEMPVFEGPVFDEIFEQTTDIERKFTDITIKYGGSAIDISRQLYMEGVVNNALEFTRYLIDHGQTRRIKTGSYTVPLDASYKEIMDIITIPR